MAKLKQILTVFEFAELRRRRQSKLNRGISSSGTSQHEKPPRGARGRPGAPRGDGPPKGNHFNSLYCNLVGNLRN